MMHAFAKRCSSGIAVRSGSATGQMRGQRCSRQAGPRKVSFTVETRDIGKPENKKTGKPQTHMSGTVLPDGLDQ